ncbi:MAG TPA: hypothetical protein VF133_12820 [Terriglobales bacterium]
MRRALLLCLFTLWGGPGLLAQVDAFGGTLTQACNRITGYFHVELSNGQSMLCTPEGHRLFMIGVDAVVPPESGNNDGQTQVETIIHKYGDAEAAWAEATARRLQFWGFNALGTYSSRFIEPTYVSDKYPKDLRGLRSHPTKLPFIALIRPAYYAMKNERSFVTEPVKNLIYGVSPFYQGHSPANGIADYYDGKMNDWLRADLAKEDYWVELRKSPYANYMIGIACEDGDEVYGFGAGDHFPTVPSRGFNNSHLGWLVATVAPIQSANATTGTLYEDTTVYTKRAWADLLRAKYHSISALNAAWGSTYTTFESSAIVVSDEPVAVGDGSTTTFSHVFAQPLPSRYSVQFKANGKLIAGDTNRDTGRSQQVAAAGAQLFGPGVQGTIDYGNGIAALKFTTPPPPGARITVSYLQNGWGIGTGLLDEDGRRQHQKWLGKDFLSLSDTRPAVRSDLNLFLKAVSGHVFSTCKSGIREAFPNTLFLGPDTLGSYGVPPRPEVLQSASEYIDVLLLAGGGGFSRRMLDYIAANVGERPIIEVNFRAANPDSELASYRMASGVPGFATQHDRGSNYQRALARVRQADTSQGFHPYVGLLWWQYADNWNEKLNWGLVTRFDNAYDGREDTRHLVNCSAPLQELNCGKESRDYGDLITSVREANLGRSPQPAPESPFNQLSLSLITAALLLSLAVGTVRSYFGDRRTCHRVELHK